MNKPDPISLVGEVGFCVFSPVTLLAKTIYQTVPCRLNTLIQDTAWMNNREGDGGRADAAYIISFLARGVMPVGGSLGRTRGRAVLITPGVVPGGFLTLYFIVKSYYP